MLVKDVILKTTTFFRDKGFASPRLDAELLLAKVLKWDRVKIYLNYDCPLSEADLSACREMVRRRAQGEPIAYILEEKDFYKSTFFVKSGVLIPRPETEIIVEEVCTWFHDNSSDKFQIVDFGTGSGCIGLSLLREINVAKLLGVDFSATAISIALENANRLEVSDRAQFLCREVEVLEQNDIDHLLPGPVDVIVANPPYIAENDVDVAAHVRAFEPASALFSPEEGLAHIHRWTKKAAELVRPGGLVMMEIGHTQAAAVARYVADQKVFEDIRIVKDLAQKERFIRCQKVNSNG